MRNRFTKLTLSDSDRGMVNNLHRDMDELETHVSGLRRRLERAEYLDDTGNFSLATDLLWSIMNTADDMLYTLEDNGYMGDS